MALTQSTFGGYAALTAPVSAAAQTEILEEIDKVIALIPNPDDASTPESPLPPEFDRIHPAMARQLRAELTALKTAIDATSTA